MSDLPEPQRSILTIEEAISLVAWGASFSGRDFMAVDGIESYRQFLAVSQPRRDAIAEKLKGVSVAPQAEGLPQPTEANALAALFSDPLVMRSNAARDAYGLSRVPPLPDDQGPLVFLLAQYEQDIQRYQTSLDHALRAKAAMEAASGGHAYWSSDFVSGLSRAQSTIWEAIKGGTVAAHGKRDHSDPDWQEIPPRWFWHNPSPEADLGRGCITREASPPAVVGHWFDVRFERRQIEALRLTPRIDEPVWGLSETLAWIVTRDEDFANEVANEEVRLRLELRFATYRNEKPRRLLAVPSIENAANVLVDALRQATVFAYGRRDGQANLTRIPAGDWSGLHLCDRPNRAVSVGRGGTTWENLVFVRRQVLECWPQIELVGRSSHEKQETANSRPDLVAILRRALPPDAKFLLTAKEASRAFDEAGLTDVTQLKLRAALRTLAQETGLKAKSGPRPSRAKRVKSL